MARQKNEGPVTGAQIAESISSALLRAAVAIEADGQEQDLSVPITTDSAVNILTLRQDAGLDIMRHTIAAQVLARATRDLFPGSKLAIGPISKMASTTMWSSTPCPRMTCLNRRADEGHR